MPNIDFLLISDIIDLLILPNYYFSIVISTNINMCGCEMNTLWLICFVTSRMMLLIKKLSDMVVSFINIWYSDILILPNDYYPKNDINQFWYMQSWNEHITANFFCDVQLDVVSKKVMSNISFFIDIWYNRYPDIVQNLLSNNVINQ